MLVIIFLVLILLLARTAVQVRGRRLESAGRTGPGRYIVRLEKLARGLGRPVSASAALVRGTGINAGWMPAFMPP